MRKEKIAALVILLAVIIMCLCPHLIFTFIIYGLTLVIAWATANLLCKMIIGKSLKNIFFGD